MFSEALSYTARADEVVEYLALVTRHDSNRYQMFYSTMSYTRDVATLFHRVDDWLFHTITRDVQATWEPEEVEYVRRRIAQEGAMRGFCSGVEILYIVYCIARLASKQFHTHFFLYSDENQRMLSRMRRAQVRYHRRGFIHI